MKRITITTALLLLLMGCKTTKKTQANAMNLDLKITELLNDTTIEEFNTFTKVVPTGDGGYIINQSGVKKTIGSSTGQRKKSGNWKENNKVEDNLTPKLENIDRKKKKDSLTAAVKEKVSQAKIESNEKINRLKGLAIVAVLWVIMYYYSRKYGRD